MWSIALSAGLQTKGSPDRFPVRACAWVVGWAPSGGCVRSNHTVMFLSLSFSLSSPLSKNKYNLYKLKTKKIKTVRSYTKISLKKGRSCHMYPSSSEAIKKAGMVSSHLPTPTKALTSTTNPWVWDPSPGSRTGNKPYVHHQVKG